MGLASGKHGISREEIRRMMYGSLRARHYEKRDRRSNVDADTCRECGGQCCKRCGCFYSPDDFKDLSFNAMCEEIEKGCITIELVDLDMLMIGSSYAYGIRARNKNGFVVEERRFRPQGECVYLTPTGCRLQYEERPANGRLLIPSRYCTSDGLHVCYSSYGVEESLREWQLYFDLVMQLVEKYRDFDIPIPTFDSENNP